MGVRRVRSCRWTSGRPNGTYLAYLLLYSAGVVAFEPRPDAAAPACARSFGATARTRLEEVALSDEAGTAEIRVPAAAADARHDRRFQPAWKGRARCSLHTGALRTAG